MMTRKNNFQLKMHMVTIEDLVPQEHLLRKIDSLIDFSFIYDEMVDSYCSNNGRPSVDPVILVKYILIGFLYGIPSERRIEQEICVNMAYRWFLGLDITDKVPNHSTISQNRRRRFNGKDIFRKLFEKVVQQCIENGLVNGKLVFTDSTHIKANASQKSEYIEEVEVIANEYLEAIDKYEHEERKRLEKANKIAPKKCSKKKPITKTVQKRKSRTDPDAGYYSRKGKPKGMCYLSHQTVDSENGIIIDVATTPGNVSDNQPYIQRLDYIENEIGLKIEAACADKVYNTALINKQLLERNIDFYSPSFSRTPNFEGEFQRNDFTYSPDNDCFICPNEKTLKLNRLNRNAIQVSYEYISTLSDCKNCPFKEKCISGKGTRKRIQVNIFEEAVRKQHEKDGSKRHQNALRLRQIWSEGSFAAQKARHNLKFLYRRGIEAAEEQCLLSATALNLKRMIKAMV